MANVFVVKMMVWMYAVRSRKYSTTNAFTGEMMEGSEHRTEWQLFNDSHVIVKRHTVWKLFKSKCACSEKDDRGCMAHVVEHIQRQMYLQWK